MSKFRTALTLLAVAGLWLPLPSTAADTATELRLRSIEAKLPDADKLAELERKVNALSSTGGASGGAPVSGNMFSVVQDVEALQDDVRQLRGQVEELKHKLKQNEQGQRELYKNLDSRLSALEGGGSSAAPTPSQMSKMFRMTQKAHESMSVNSKSMSKISDNVSDGSFNN